MGFSNVTRDARSLKPLERFFGIKTCKHYQKKKNVTLEQILDLTQEKRKLFRGLLKIKSGNIFSQLQNDGHFE